MNNKTISFKEIFVDGLIKNNPTFVQFLGMCPTLAITNSVENAIGMGASVIFVLVLSNLVVSLIRKFVTNKVRIPVFIVVISTLVTVLEMFLNAFFPDLAESLGIFIPLIVVNCIILGRAEAFAQKNTPIKSMADGLAMGVGFTLGIMLISSFREILGNGSWLGIQIFNSDFAIPLLVKPAGAFLVFGLLVATIMAIRNKIQDKKTEEVAS